MFAFTSSSKSARIATLISVAFFKRPKLAGSALKIPSIARTASSKLGSLILALKSSNALIMSSKLGILNLVLKSSNAFLNVSRTPVNMFLNLPGKSERNFSMSSTKGSFLNLSNRFLKKSPKRLGKSSKNLARLSNEGNFTLRFFKKSKNRRSPSPRPRSTSVIKFTIFPRRASPSSRNLNTLLNLARISSNFVLSASKKPLRSFRSLSKPFANAPAIASPRFFRKFRKLFSSPLPNPKKAFRRSDNILLVFFCSPRISVKSFFCSKDFSSSNALSRWR